MDKWYKYLSYGFIVLILDIIAYVVLVEVGVPEEIIVAPAAIIIIILLLALIVYPAIIIFHICKKENKERLKLILTGIFTGMIAALTIKFIEHIYSSNYVIFPIALLSVYFISTMAFLVLLMWIFLSYIDKK